MVLPSSQTTPMNTCPGLRPRWCPEYSPYRTQDFCLPNILKPSAFPFRFGKVISKTTTMPISGLNTEPVFLIHSAPDSRYRVDLRVSLLTCRLGFNQVGLEACLPHPLGNNIEFHEPSLTPNDLDLSWHESILAFSITPQY